MPSKSINLKAPYSEQLYTLKVAFSESKENIDNNTTEIKITASLSASKASYQSASSLKIYWYDNQLRKTKLVKEYNFNSCGMNYGTRSVTDTIIVKHKEDGSLSGYAQVRYTASQTPYTPPDTTIKTSTSELTTIPQSATIESVEATELGKKVIVKINRKSNSFIHKVDYYFEDYANRTSVDGNAQNSVEFIPPVTLSSYLINGITGKLTVRVGTYKSDGKTRVGSIQSKIVNCKIPSSVIPTMEAPIATLLRTNMPSNWNVYIQGFAGVEIKINNARGIYGSTIKSYRIIGSGINTTSPIASCSILKESGKISYLCEVTDSRGRKVSKTIEIDVLPYRPPSAAVKAERCLINGDPATNGTSLLATVNFSVDSLNGNNYIKSKFISCNASSTTTFESGKPFVFDCNISISSTYELIVEITDALNRVATLNIEIPSAERIWNAKDDGFCIGGFSEMSGFTVKWPSLFEKEISVEGVKISKPKKEPVVFKSNFKNYYINQNPVTIKKFGPIISLQGIATNIKEGTYVEEVMFQIPEWARPKEEINSIQQGSGSNRFTMIIKTNGDVCIDRYSNNTSIRNKTPANSWLNCFITYIID